MAWRRHQSDRLLVSVCNLSEPRTSGLLVVATNQQAHWVDLGRSSADITSGCGMVRSGRVVYHVYVAPETRLAAIDARSLEVLDDYPLPEVQDPHSVCIHRGRLHVVSTGTDQILSYGLVKSRPICTGQVWSPSGAMRDLHHINGLAEFRGDLWCSAIGPKVGTLWAEARCGYITNITKGRRALDDLWHPHSLIGHRRNIYYCDSSRSRVLTLGGYVAAQAGDGYVRGLAISRSRIFVGSSVGRARSRSTGVHNPADPGEPSGTCAVRIFDLLTGTCLNTVDLSPFAKEIYDILPA